MAFGIHAEERRELHEAWVDLRPAPFIAVRHFGDQIPLEPIYRLWHGQFVDFGRVDARIDRPGHQGHAAGLRRIAVFRHQRRGGEDGDARLAHGDDVGARAHHSQEFNQMVNVGAEIEAAIGEGHIANVMPVGDVDVVAVNIVLTVARNSVAKWPDIGATTRTLGCISSIAFLK